MARTLLNKNVVLTVNGEDVALAYYNEMQLIPGFDVLPMGVVKQKLMAQRVMLIESADFQQIARRLARPKRVHPVPTISNPTGNVTAKCPNHYAHENLQRS
ncbi:MAG: hypothetical protein ABGX22_27895 [Pirellulaceae bacterium]